MCSISPEYIDCTFNPHLQRNILGYLSKQFIEEVYNPNSEAKTFDKLVLKDINQNTRKNNLQNPRNSDYDVIGFIFDNFEKLQHDQHKIDQLLEICVIFRDLTKIFYTL